MTNLLDLVPSLDRQLHQYKATEDTDSALAAYCADAIEALAYRWDRDYVISTPAPRTYMVSPDVVAKDKRPIIVMASIIYKMGKWDQTYIRDGDFAVDPRSTRPPQNPIILETTELNNMLPSQRLAVGVAAPLRGFETIYNLESYSWLNVLKFLEEG